MIDDILEPGLVNELHSLSEAGVRPIDPHRVAETAIRTAARRPVMPARLPELGRFGRTLLSAAAAVVVAIVVINLLFQRGPAVGVGPATASPPRPTDLGIFEAARGRIVYRVNEHLVAVDPADPASSVVIEPGDLEPGNNAMPVGFSADGSKLAITDEYNGRMYVMDRTGELNRVPVEAIRGLAAGCCAFVDSPWLSPDGTHALRFAAPTGPDGSLWVLDLNDVPRSRHVQPDVFHWTNTWAEVAPLPAWSPDGTHAAFVWSQDGDLYKPAIGIVNLETGESRELASGWGVIRHLVWSPDGTQLRVVAIEDKPAQLPEPN